jgi:hypothetical protein
VVRWALKSFWTPVGAGVKSDEEVDALALYLFADAPEGRQAVRDVDGMVRDLPGLQGLTLLEDVLDRAIERARRKPGWAGMGPGVVHGAQHDGAQPNGRVAAPSPTHWRPADVPREDALAPQPGEPAKHPA